MEKKYDFSLVTHIRRDYYGVVIEIVYKNRKWSKKLLRERLRLDPDVQKAALRVILEAEKIEINLDKVDKIESNRFRSDKSKHLVGFAPREAKLVPTFEHILKTQKPLDEMEVVSLGKFLPKYAEQIWLRLLLNLNIKYRAQTFSTTRRARRK